MGITQFFASLFETNEFAYETGEIRILTDDEIARAVEQEFPDRPSAHVYRGKKKKRTVNEYRNYYNDGKFTELIPPKKLSFRYNREGERVNGRSGKPLVEEQIRHMIEKHSRYRKEVCRTLLGSKRSAG